MNRHRTFILDNIPATLFFEESIEVDGVRGLSSNHLFSRNMFDLKEDFYDTASTWIDDEGLEWVDDTKRDTNWDGAYSPVRFKFGEINEEAWMSHKLVLGEREDGFW